MKTLNELIAKTNKIKEDMKKMKILIAVEKQFQQLDKLEINPEQKVFQTCYSVGCLYENSVDLEVYECTEDGKLLEVAPTKLIVANCPNADGSWNDSLEFDVNEFTSDIVVIENVKRYCPSCEEDIEQSNCYIFTK